MPSSATLSCGSIVILSTALNVAFTGPIAVGLPWLVLVRFGGDAFASSASSSRLRRGSLAGVILAGSLGDPGRFGGLVLVLLLGVGLGSWASAWLRGTAVTLSRSSAAAMRLVNVSIISWTQARTEPHLLGRTMSFMMLGAVVSAPLSIALAGVVVDANATAMFLAAGGLVLGVSASGLATGLHRRMAA